MASAKHNIRPNRESLRKRLGERTYRAILVRDGYRCMYCGCTAEQSGAHLQLDHLTPRAAGGADVGENLVLACRSCNSRRQAKRLSAWCRGLGLDARAIRRHAARFPRFFAAT